jgi:hypothetical protein
MAEDNIRMDPREVVREVGWIHLAQGRSQWMEGSYGHSNGRSGSVKDGKFLAWLSDFRTIA